MATTKTTYTGNGTNKLFSFSFPYLFPVDIKVQLNGVNTTAYTFANATTIEMNTAPTSGAVVTIFRDTTSDSMVAEFYPGSAIRAQDLNDDFSQVLYVVQENKNLATEANTLATGVSGLANTALSQSSSALAASTSATAVANTALNNSSAAVTTANAANVTATSANTTANLALSVANNSINYTLVVSVATIPTSPSNDQYIEINNSTGIQSFTPLAGLPSGFIGSPSLSVRLRYSSAGSTWNFYNYYANNTEARYLNLAGGTLTGPLALPGAPTSGLQAATKAYVDAQLAKAYFFGSF
jgi:hypothetical protein